MTIRVLIADDEPLAVAGIRFVLDGATDIVVVAEATGHDVVEVVAQCRPDVIVLEHHANGDEVIGKVNACGVGRVLVLTAHHTVRRMCDALVAGAAGYLLKANATGALAEGVRAIAGIGTWLDPIVMNDLLRELSSQPVAGDVACPPNHLTPREQQILVLMAQGLSNSDMSLRLHISVLTVRTHVGRVFMKLDARNRAHAVTTAYRKGLIQISPII